MVVTSTLGVEASHGHDIAADIDGGAAQPVVEMRFQLKYVFVCVYGGGISKCSRIMVVTININTVTVVEKISLTK